MNTIRLWVISELLSDWTDWFESLLCIYFIITFIIIINFIIIIIIIIIVVLLEMICPIVVAI